ncbi:MAG: geopeptide radical SAM maturase [bacterium]
MQLSKYVKIFPNFSKEKPDYLLLYSTKKTSCVLISKSVFNSIKQGTLSPKNMESLSKLGFLVSDLNEERSQILGRFDEINKRDRRFNAIVIMNLHCNLACKYCFERGVKGKFYMSSETAESLIDYIEKNIFHNKQEVNICFYGGEPLLSFGLIKYISERLKVSAEKKGLNYTFCLVTNGTLLTRKRTEELVQLGLKKAKITIDGPRDNHNNFRPFKSGSESFKIIIKNIKDIYDLINIQLGGNFNFFNYKDFPALLDFLYKEDLTPDKLSMIKFDPIIKTETEFGLPDFNGGCKSTNEAWLLEASLFLREEILKRGFNTPKLAPASCMVELKNDIVVYFNGTFYKCPGFIGRKDFEIGSLWSGIKDYKESHALEFWKKSECFDCEYLPLCFGGCRYMKLLRDGKIDDIDCRKPYLDAILETFIKQEIKYIVKSFDNVGSLV